MGNVPVRPAQRTAPLLALFVVSGATALVYQTVWVRQLHLVLGTSSTAVATVLAAFMGGLGIGGLAIAGVADRVRRPVAVYGGLEAGIGLYALVFPSLLAALEPMLLALPGGPDARGIAAFFLVGALLLPPTCAMGATLPLLARFATDRMAAVGAQVGRLYAANTAGAVVGTALSGFVLLPTLGLGRTTCVAAAANLALAAGAAALDRRHGAPAPMVDDLPHDLLPTPRAVLWPLVALLAGAGAVGLLYEVAWTRLMALTLGGSTYAFSSMLLALLAGIAIGGHAGGSLADVLQRRGGQPGVLFGLGAVELGIAATVWVGTFVWTELPYWYVWGFDALGGAEHPVTVWLLGVGLCGIVLTPPAVGMGMALPLAVRAVSDGSAGLGRPVGLLVGANTLGGVAGSFLAGFVLLPVLQVQGTVTLGVVASALLGVVGFGLAKRRGPALLAVASTALWVGVRAPWDPLWMTGGMYQYVSQFDNHSREGIYRYAVEKYELLFYAEGRSSVVTVARNLGSGNLWLANNGKVDASSTSDMPTQVLCSLLPLSFAEDPEDVLVIGLASGVTAGSAGLDPRVDSLQIVELEGTIQQAARWFDDVNHQVLDDPRTELITDDGRHHVQRAAPGTWDAVISEPSNPWISGVSNLFTAEFWQVGRTRLAPGGVWGQWVQVYGMSQTDVRSLLATFADTFPHVLVFTAIDDADLVLIGAEHELKPTLAHLTAWLQDPVIAAEMELIGLADPVDLLAAFALDRDAIVRWTADAPRNTDDNLRIEVNAPLSLHADTQGANFAALMERARVPWQGVDDPLELADLAEAYVRMGDARRAQAAFSRAAMQLDPRDPLHAVWLARAANVLTTP